MTFIPYSEEREREAEKSRQRWVSMTKREKRQGIAFGLFLWLAGMSVVLFDVLTNTRFM